VASFVRRACAPGCRGADGNGCPNGQICTSTDGEAGVCEDLVELHFGGGGCDCSVRGEDGERASSALLVLLSLLVVRRRRRGR
jgi:MYXO-CTERM domain-containing protein